MGHNTSISCLLGAASFFNTLNQCHGAATLLVKQFSVTNTGPQVTVGGDKQQSRRCHRSVPRKVRNYAQVVHVFLEGQPDQIVPGTKSRERVFRPCADAHGGSGWVCAQTLVGRSCRQRAALQCASAGAPSRCSSVQTTSGRGCTGTDAVTPVGYIHRFLLAVNETCSVPRERILQVNVESEVHLSFMEFI